MARIGIDIRKWSDFGIGEYLRGLLGALLPTDEENHYFLFARPEECELIPPLSRRQQVLPEAAGTYTIRELFALHVACRKWRLDLLHVPHYTVPPRLPCPSVITLHDLIHLTQPGSRIKHLYARLMMGTAARDARRVIVPSRATCDELIRRFPATLSRVRVIRHGLPPTLDTARTPSSASALRLPSDYILFVGNERPYKNLTGVLEAFALVRENYQGQLVLAGLPLPPSTSFLERLDRLSLRSQVRWTGYLPRPQLEELYRRARLLVAPSTAEGFGFPLLEAMAAGTPVVTSRGGATEEVVGQTALLVDPMNVEEIARAVNRLLTEPELARELSLRGKKRTEEFSWQESARETLALYREILSE